MFQKVAGIYNYQFSVDVDGLYSISLTATCKKKNYLRVEIDGVALKGISPKGKFFKKIGDTYFYWSPN